MEAQLNAVTNDLRHARLGQHYWKQSLRKAKKEAGRIRKMALKYIKSNWKDGKAVSPELAAALIDLDLQRRRISLSIKQAAEGGVVSPEWRDHFGEEAFDVDGNYVGGGEYTSDTDAFILGPAVPLNSLYPSPIMTLSTQAS